MWLAVLLIGCGSRKAARPPEDAAPPTADASPPSTEFLAVVTAPENGLAPACTGGTLAPALAGLAAEIDCRHGPVTGYRAATVRGHQVVMLLDATGDLRGRLDGKPIDKIRLDEAPVVDVFPPAVLATFDDAELGALLSTLAGVAMINPGRRIGYTAAALRTLGAEWPPERIEVTPTRVFRDRDQRRVRLWYQLFEAPDCHELYWSDVWIDGTGTIDQLTHRSDRRGASCNYPPPHDPDRGNFFPD